MVPHTPVPGAETREAIVRARGTVRRTHERLRALLP